MYNLEEFDDLKGFEGYYLINRDGIVLSLKSNKKGGGIQPLKHKNGTNVSLVKDGKEYHRSIKVLIRKQYLAPVDLTDFFPMVEFRNYMINRKGDIYSLFSNKLMSLQPDHKGYLRIRLTGNDGKMVTRKVHRLVAQQFIPNPENKPQVNHKDCNKQNNHYINLEWMTNLENMQHGIANGCFDYHYNAKP